MAKCKECGKEFFQNRPFQVFCCDSCKGAFHRRKYRQIAVEEAEDRREARMNGGNGHATPEQRKALAGIVQGLTPRFVRRV